MAGATNWAMYTGQFTYWRRKPEVSPDEDLRWEVETSIKYVKIGCAIEYFTYFRYQSDQTFTELRNIMVS